MIPCGTSSGNARGRSLAALTAGMLDAPAGMLVSDVTLDSRDVRPGALFLACRGAMHHGLEFATAAIASGARAILYEEPTATETVPAAACAAAARSAAAHQPAVFMAGIPHLGRHVGTIADRFFDSPSQFLSVAAVTGTNGKTTCAYLLAQALTRCGRSAGYIGTLGYGPAAALQPFGLTTADAVSVHRQLAHLRELGSECVGMEVSSHALEQGRVGAVRFRAAAFTNLTRDHLDYHGSMDAYGAAKARLFRLPDLESRIINIDDPFGLELAAGPAGPGALIVTTRRPAESSAPQAVLAARFVRAREVRIRTAALSVAVESSWGQAEIDAPLIGDFNVDNVLTVLAVLLSFDVPPATAAAALGECRAAPGRMQVVREPGVGVLAIVDYAHTPDALAKALRAARTQCGGRLHAVFGCGGDRDPGKRSQMGRVAAELADEIVLTDDNPRSEPPSRIVAGIIAGIPTHAVVRIEHDRARAICGALEGAGEGDVVLIAGKGHEDYQLYGNERRAFSDQLVAGACLRRMKDRACGAR